MATALSWPWVGYHESQFSPPELRQNPGLKAPNHPATADHAPFHLGRPLHHSVEPRVDNPTRPRTHATISAETLSKAAS